MEYAGPRCSRKDDGSIHLSYNVAHRIHVAKAYPVQAPNGSTVVVYGHEYGLTFLWRGGRPFKRVRNNTEPSLRTKRNGSRTSIDADVVMTTDGEIDSEALDSSTTLDNFEAVEDIADPSSYPSIMHSYVIPLESPVLHVAFAPVTSQVKAQTLANRYSDPDFPQIFAQDIVVAITSSDASIHIVTVPLMPSPSRTRQQRTRANHNHQDIIISLPRARSSLRKIPTAISLTWTSDLVASPTDHPAHTSQDQLDKAKEKRSLSRRLSIEPQERTWTLLLAATTSESSGVLKIYAISAHCKGSSSELEAGSLHVLRTEYLPALARTISFKPTTYPSRSHAQLLVTDVQGAVRLYDPLHGSHSFPRRIESSAQRGQWLASLYCPFEQPSSTSSGAGVSEPRLRILDASWAMSGACIIVLLANGSWGVWDIDGSGPNRKRGLLQGTLASVGSISGAGTTPFALRGLVGRRHNSRHDTSASEGSTGAEREPKKLAPMTPKTRRAKQERLFTQETNKAVIVSDTARGGISAVAKWTIGEQLDDSVLFWYDTEIYSIPSMRGYWQNAANRSLANKGGLQGETIEGTLHGSSMSSLQDFSVGGEAITNASQILPPADIGVKSSHILSPEFVISAEHRLVVIQPPSSQTSHLVEHELDKLFAPPEDTEPRPGRLDQDLLARGELDLGGMDRMLNGMNAPRGPAIDDVFGGPSQRRVAFAPEI